MKRHLNNIEFGREYYTFWIAHVMSDMLVMNFFQIMLYKATQSLDVVILSYCLNSIVTFVGIVVGGILLDRFGYLKMYRISFFLSALGLLVVALLLTDIGSYYPLFSILIFVPRGLFWITVHSVELRETNCGNRKVKFNVTQGLYLVLSVVVSPIVGFLLASFNGYWAMFVAASIVYLVAVMIPYKYNKQSRSSLTSVEIVNILKSPRFPAFLGINLVYGAFYAIGSLCAILSSYLVLGNELSVGIVVSIASLVGGVMILVNKAVDEKHMVKLGFLSNWLIAIFNLGYAVLWTPLSLVVNRVVGGGMSGWASSTIGDQDYRARELLLGKELHRSAVEMNLVVEGIYMVGRVVTTVVVLLVIRGSVVSHSDIVRVGFGVSGFGGIAVFLLFLLYNSKAVRSRKEG